MIRSHLLRDLKNMENYKSTARDSPTFTLIGSPD
jgi:hypothetical protein